MSKLLSVASLSVSIDEQPLLRQVGFEIANGATLGLVGESGSGKSLTALTLLGLQNAGMAVDGTAEFDGTDLLALSERELRLVRGKQIGIVFQEPMTALNPVHTAEWQVAETVLIHEGVPRDDAVERARTHLSRVGIAPKLAARYPHQLSGGQRQRVVVAMATILSPKLVIADEPTTALDVVRQKEVLDLLRDLHRDSGSALLLITHDLGVVADMASDIVVMRDGRVVERTRSADLMQPERDAYTKELVVGAALPARPAATVTRGEDGVALALRNVGRVYRDGLFGSRRTEAVSGVNLELPKGGTLGLVGESGCGKSTLARMALALDRPTTGEVRWNGTAVNGIARQELRALRPSAQIVFQDPNGSLDPRRRIGWSIGEPLHAVERSHRTIDHAVAEALERVGLAASDAERFPHEFSGGQRQRIAIARAIVGRPSFVVADEPVSALDVSLRARVLALFEQLRADLGIAFLLITHDLQVVRAATERVAIMHEGRIVEEGPTAKVFDAPRHEATRRLLEATLDLETAVRRRQAIDKSASVPTSTA